MLLIETNSISNMGCQKFKIIRSLRYSGYLTNTSFVCQVSFFSAHLDNKQKPNKNSKSQKTLLTLEKSKALPTLRAFIKGGYDGNNDSFKFFKSDQKWYGYSIAGVSMSVPIFSSLRRSAKTQQARIEDYVDFNRQVLFGSVDSRISLSDGSKMK